MIEADEAANSDMNGMKVVLSAPASLASVALGQSNTSLASRAKCFILVREQVSNGANPLPRNERIIHLYHQLLSHFLHYPTPS